VFPKVGVQCLNIVRINFRNQKFNEPILIVAQSKAWACGRSHAGILGPNSTGGMDVLSLVNIWCYKGTGLCNGLIPRPGEFCRVCMCH
jgi:hypothetical protein